MSDDSKHVDEKRAPEDLSDSPEELAKAGVSAVGTTTDGDEEAAALGTDLQFTEEEEKAVRLKLDLRIIPVVTILYLANFIDRTNVGNAKVAGLEGDLGLVGYQYNIGLSIFFIAYAFTEVPSNLLLKRIGATVWIPSMVLFFGLVSLVTAWLVNFEGFIVIRIFLGIAEGGMMPGVAYYLSTFYRRHELALRIGLFVSASGLAGAFGGLLATAFLSIPQLDGVPHGRWRNIFLLEGAITMLLAICGYFLLPRDAESCKFLTERQRLIARERVRVENAGLNKVEQTDMKLVIRAFRSINNWICALGFFLVNISVQGISLFMPTLLAGQGNSPLQSQLLSVPPYVVASFWAIFVAWASARTGKRGLWVLLTAPISLVGLGLLAGTADTKAGYAAIFLWTMGAFPLGPLFLTWGNNNSAPYTTRAVCSAMIVGIGSFGPIVAAWSYLPTDGPRYLKGIYIALGCQTVVFCISVFLVLWNLRENRLRKQGKRDYRLQADEETVSKLGHLHPKFRLTI